MFNLALFVISILVGKCIANFAQGKPGLAGFRGTSTMVY